MANVNRVGSVDRGRGVGANPSPGRFTALGDAVFQGGIGLCVGWRCDVGHAGHVGAVVNTGVRGQYRIGLRGFGHIQGQVAGVCAAIAIDARIVGAEGVTAGGQLGDIIGRYIDRPVAVVVNADVAVGLAIEHDAQLLACCGIGRGPWDVVAHRARDRHHSAVLGDVDYIVACDRVDRDDGWRGFDDHFVG